MGTEDKTPEPRGRMEPPTGSQVEKALGMPAGKNTVEHWAKEKGMLPARFPGAVLKPTIPTSGARSIPVNLAAYAEHGPRDNPKHVHFAAAKAMHRWPEGAELTEVEFDAAVAKAYGPLSEVICR